MLKIILDLLKFHLVNTSKGTNQQTTIVMAKRCGPLALPVDLNPMPNNYNQRIKQFGAEGDFIAQQHVDWFQDFVDLEEVDEEDVKMRLFAQSLKGEVKKWFKALTPRSIVNSRIFEQMLLDRWEEKKNYVQMLT